MSIDASRIHNHNKVKSVFLTSVSLCLYYSYFQLSWLRYSY